MDRTKLAYAALLVLFCFVGTYQLRWSLETFDVERRLNFYVPFVLKPFTNEVAAKGWFIGYESGSPPDEQHSVGLHPGDRLLATNGHPFQGLSVYLRELQKAQKQPPPEVPVLQWSRLRLTVALDGAGIRQVDVGFPHCTCGVPSALEAATLWVAAPLFCVLLGFAAAAIRPRSLSAWAFLLLVLSLSQLQLFPDMPGWQLTSNAMAWEGWMRIPGVAYREFVQLAWPAALLAGAASFLPGKRRALLAAAGGFLIYAGLQTALQVAWSEDYRRAVGLYEALQHSQLEIRTAALIGISLVAWLVSRPLGIAVTAASGAAATAPLVWHAGPIVTGHWQKYSDDSLRFDASIPAFHGTTGFLLSLFVAACLLAVIVVFRRSIRRYESAGFAMVLPLAVQVAGSLGSYWWPMAPAFGMWWFWLILGSSGSGVLALWWSVLRRTAQ